MVAETADHVNSEAFEVVKVADHAAAEQAVLAGQVDAAVVPNDTPSALTVLAADSPPMSLVQALSALAWVELLKPPPRTRCSPTSSLSPSALCS